MGQALRGTEGLDDKPPPPLPQTHTVLPMGALYKHIEMKGNIIIHTRSVTVLLHTLILYLVNFMYFKLLQS